MEQSEATQRDRGTEQWLDRERVNWAYLTGVRIDAIDLQASMNNQARLEGKLNSELVTRFSVAMFDGAIFPAPIAYLRNGRYVLIGGNHRVRAMIEAGIMVTGLYVINSSDLAVIERLTRTDNLRVGLAYTQEEALIHAKTMRRKHGYTLEEAARLFRLKPSVLQDAIKAEETASRLAANGINPAKIMPWAIVRFGALRSDKVLKVAAETAMKHGFDSTIISEMVTACNKRRSEDQAIAVAESFYQRPDVQERLAKLGSAKPSGGARSDPLRHRTRILALVNQLVSHAKKYPTLTETQITTPTDARRIRDGFMDVWKLYGTQLSVIIARDEDNAAD